jgi:hypothetical protein
VSRSRKKTPAGGITVKQSDKPFKVVEHRRERRAVNIALRADIAPPHPKTYGNPWASCKDGKQYWIDHDPKWMRK